MSHAVIQFAFAFAGYPLVSLAWTLAEWRFRWLAARWRGFAAQFLYLWAFGGGWGVVAGLWWMHDQWWSAGSAATLAVALAVRWWRKRRDRVKALLGAKSRALRDALAARMPRPVVLRPVRGGAS